MKNIINPYINLPSEKYWKTGVFDRPTNQFTNIWKPRFEINASTKFSTSGSCFAQHISNWLKLNGFSWLDSEPPPLNISGQESKDFGYSIFTFRTGNIYTAALQKQWVYWALELEVPSDEFIEHEGIFYDPFRPLIPLKGYLNLNELYDERNHTFKCIRKTLTETNIFIFTLGLTEGWMNSEGYTYPMCPGTVRGAFNKNVHLFFNQDFQSVYQDLNNAFDAINKINPSIKFLLTVSPVPLTATASNDHVLVATNYSKSVLRSVAGALTQLRNDVDYFPSYELISSPAMRGIYFDENLRTVKKEGVDFVMSHFQKGVLKKDQPFLEKNQHQKKPASIANSYSENAEEFCEDILLETWNHNKIPFGNEKICLIGNSHMGLLSKSLDKIGLAHRGGMIMNGSAWFAGNFHLDNDELFVPLEDKGARKRWLETLSFFETTSNEKIVILNIGMDTHVSVPNLISWFKNKNGHLNLNENVNDINEFFTTFNKKQIEIFKKLISRNFKILVITDPPTQKAYSKISWMLPAFLAYELIAEKFLKQIGCEFLNLRNFFKDSVVPEEFLSREINDENGESDWIHGSSEYYDWLANKISEEYL